MDDVIVSVVSKCAEKARQKVQDETGDRYLANRVWRAVVGLLAPEAADDVCAREMERNDNANEE